MIVNIEDIVMDPALQSRAATKPSTAEEYRKVSEEGGTEWPFSRPIELVESGGCMYLVDGYYRVAACIASGRLKAEANVTVGTISDAIMMACGANSGHGEKRTKADIVRAVGLALGAFPKASNGLIAQIVVVSKTTVATIRTELQIPPTAKSTVAKRETVTGKDGREYKVKEPVPKKAKVARVTEETQRIIEVGKDCQECALVGKQSNWWELTDGGLVCEECGASEDDAVVYTDHDDIPFGVNVPVANDPDRATHLKRFRAATGQIVRIAEIMGWSKRLAVCIESLVQITSTER